VTYTAPVRAGLPPAQPGPARVDQAAGGIVVASYDQDGPLVAGLSVGTLLELVYDYTFNYPAFLSLAESLVNQAVIVAEEQQPEQSQMELVVYGFGSQASNLASRVNADWQQGKIVNTDGTTLQPWPGAAAIAYGDDAAGTLTLQWIKASPWVWIVVGILLAALGAALYYILTSANYRMTSTPPSSQVALTSGPAFLAWAVQHWYVWVIGAGAMAAAPFVVRKVAELREAENELQIAEQGAVGFTRRARGPSPSYTRRIV
jgi:hypothetical protein